MPRFGIMTKPFRTYLPEQDLLLPPSLREWLPEDHLAYFVSTWWIKLDLSAIESVVLGKNSIVASNPSQPLNRLLRRSSSIDRYLTETGRNRGTPASGRDEPDRGTNRRVLRPVHASRCR